MPSKKIHSALISVYYKDGLEPIVRQLHQLGVHLYSTGGTQTFIQSLGIPVTAVEDITGYPSILDGRVKTLHPKVFGGILARRQEHHLAQLEEYGIPPIDLVIVDLYPFQETLAHTTDQSAIIEKIDIGGISLIRAAAKNFADTVIIPSVQQYPYLLNLLLQKQGYTNLDERQYLALQAFHVSSHYDTAIYQYFNQQTPATTSPPFKQSIEQTTPLRYGENPHQQAQFYGNLDQAFLKISGKEISYNNLVDIDAAINLINEFKNSDPTTVVIKHTNSCGVATRNTPLDSWNAALACDNTSAFGGIIATNYTLDIPTAQAINQLFFEALIAPGYTPEALDILTKNTKRIILQQNHTYHTPPTQYKSLLNGVVQQTTDLASETTTDLKTVTLISPTPHQTTDLLFAAICCKHLKSNAIALVKNQQLIGMGCGQTSRIDALRQAIAKAQSFHFDLQGAVMASDAFFPFPDCVTLAHQAGITAVIQPGGSIRDQDSIQYCDQNHIAMVTTGIRHFKH
jgi:phosphoribosylaminoimidazolecarboxamide formyltransferase/IMP cyclohydrolase